MTNSVIAYVLNAKKILVYVLGILAQVLALGFLPADIAAYGYGILAVASGIGIYRASNVPLDAPGDHALA
jgi:hypothetical protein